MYLLSSLLRTNLNEKIQNGVVGRLLPHYCSSVANEKLFGDGEISMGGSLL